MRTLVESFAQAIKTARLSKRDPHKITWGTASKQWHVIDPSDRDFHTRFALTADEAEKHGEEKSRAISTAARTLREEPEQLDELKKSTLKSYIKKAAKDVSHHSYSAGYKYGYNERDGFRKPLSQKDNQISNKRKAGIERATDKLEESEQIDELHKDTLKSYIKKSSLNLQNRSYHSGKGSPASGGVKKMMNRSRGIERATDKLEEDMMPQEPLNELKKSTLRSYINKAADDNHERGKYVQKLNHYTKAKGVEEKQWQADAVKKASYRSLGISRAVDKLEEDTMPNEELHEEAPEVTINPFVLAAISGNGAEAKDLLNADLSERILGALAAQKAEVASTLFATELSEETEQLDEISLKAASGAYTARMKRSDDAPLGSQKSLDQYKIASKTRDRIRKKHGAPGVAYAVTADHENKKKLKEETEQIDELKKSTLKSYVKKAVPDARKRMASWEKNTGKWSKTDDEHIRKVNNRIDGIRAAKKKLK